MLLLLLLYINVLFGIYRIIIRVLFKKKNFSHTFPDENLTNPKQL